MIMQYRKDKNGNEISVLGYGCMRFTKEGGHADIDKAEKEVMAAIDAGVNYLDTAYVYAGNEAAVGEILARNHCRERIYLATKLPHYLIKSVEGAQKMFEEELRRLQTDYIDYYLMHMLTDLPTWEKLKKLGMEDWIREKKASGEIRNIGFSYHGRSDMFMQLIDAYDWDFCQIQYNYMDEHSQAGVEGLRYAHAKGIPVIIMEPLRGGRLVNLLPESAKELFAQDEEHRTPAELALKWLYDQPEVTCVLSGMNSMEMVEQNVRTASEYGVGCMTESDRALVEAVRQEITKHVKVGMHRLRLLYAVPTRGGYPRDIPLLQCDVLRRKKVRPQGLPAVYGIPQESGERLTVCGMRQMRAALSAAYRDPRGVKSGGGRT